MAIKRRVGRERSRGGSVFKQEELSAVAAAQGGLPSTYPLFFDLFIRMKKAATGQDYMGQLCFLPDPDLIGFYEGPNHFQLSTFSDIP